MLRKETSDMKSLFLSSQSSPAGVTSQKNIKMIQLATLKSCLTGLVANPEKQVVTGAGYNAIIEMVMNRQQDFPCVVLEEQDGGILSIQPGGFDKYPQSIWVLDRCASNENPEQYYVSTKQLLKEIISSLSRNSDDYPDLEYVDFGRMPYLKRQGGNELYGWEVILTTEEDIDLS